MARLKISRMLAMAAGLKHYYTGKACKRGHYAQRFVACKTCLTCHAEAERAKRLKTRKTIDRRKFNFDSLDWKPISSAPKNTEVLIKGKFGPHPFVTTAARVSIWNDGVWAWETHFSPGVSGDVTHWTEVEL
jgi:hypothetical protein